MRRGPSKQAARRMADRTAERLDRPRVERSALFDTWVAYMPGGRTIAVTDTEAEARAAADAYMQRAVE